MATHLGRARLQIVLQQVVEVRLGPRHRQGIPAESGDRVGVEAVHDLPTGDHAADGQPVAEALGEREQVGRHVVGLVSPEVLAGAAPPGLDLVGDEEDPVLVEHLLHRPEEAVRRRHEAADALDGLGDHAGHVAGGGDGEQVLQIGDAGRGEFGIGQVPEGASVLVPAVHVGHLER